MENCRGCLHEIVCKYSDGKPKMISSKCPYQKSMRNFDNAIFTRHISTILELLANAVEELTVGVSNEIGTRSEDYIFGCLSIAKKKLGELEVQGDE